MGAVNSLSQTRKLISHLTSRGHFSSLGVFFFFSVSLSGDGLNVCEIGGGGQNKEATHQVSRLLNLKLPSWSWMGMFLERLVCFHFMVSLLVVILSFVTH
jgi:hypothetical protein